MIPDIIPVRKSLNKAYLKVKPTRSEIELFKTNLISLFNQVKENESEEYHKNIIVEFLKNTYFKPNHYINTRGKTDLVIHNGKDSKSTVGVIIETKRPSNKAEMPTKEKINCKALHELVLYYLRERISDKNLEIKYLIATNLYDWFVFNAQDFEKVFAKNRRLLDDFEKFEARSLSGTTTDFFYNEIAKPFIDGQEVNIPVTWFDLRDYKTIVKNDSKEDDKKLIEIYKILSPEHLLKLPFSNDSSTLDKRFYNELLHIIGLEERKEGSKKLIGRKAEGKRDNGSLIENAINILNYEDCLRDIKNPTDYGENKEEQLYHIALELSITWINRILFLKLLEGQLVKYNNDDKSYKFLNVKVIPDYDALNKLFFHVLAVKENERSKHVRENYKKIPYLNSSLFEPNELEHKTIRISNLEDDYNLPIISGTVLKDNTGKKRNGKINPLVYIFDFLDAYDFSSEGSEDISEENKTLINASVLGLIFEKINGYKDGSFFTPGFITMYMCRETIRRAVVQKFNEAKDWKCENLDDLYNRIGDIDKKEANAIINSLRICDPAVGSGHFLVSALNEIITIKSELKILVDSKGKVLRDYHIEVENDELAITDEDGKFFEYHPKNPESQRIQEALFHEKQTIIENCLFGVDINQNSVKICRLRLWIELLKNAYYKPDSGFTELETLPNIDINIKYGNSLISRYPLDADIRKALKKSKWTIDSYRIAVMTYRNAENKEEKASMRKLIEEIKSDFESEVSKSDKRFLRLNKLKGELLNLTGQQNLFEMEGKQKADWEKKEAKTTKEIDKLETELDEIQNNKIYENAFEWRFEFPEVLNEEGDFLGFDVVIGNPPYIRQEEIKDNKSYYQSQYENYSGVADIYIYFIERGINVLQKNGEFIYILPNKWFLTTYAKNLRNWLKNFTIKSIIDFGDLPVFEEATTYPCILHINNSKSISNTFKAAKVDTLKFSTTIEDYISNEIFEVDINNLQDQGWLLADKKIKDLINKIQSNSIPLETYVGKCINRGIITGYNRAFIIGDSVKNMLIHKDRNSGEIIFPFITGKDLKRYKNPTTNRYIIFTRRGIDIKKYPAVYEYIKEFKTKLLPKPKDWKGTKWEGRKSGVYKWYEIQDSIDYYKDFEKPKILYPNICRKPEFTFDNRGLYANQKCFIIPKSDMFLLGILNSNVHAFLYSELLPKLRGGFFEPSYTYLKDFPIPKEKNDSIEDLVNKVILLYNSDNQDEVSIVENQINEMVYQIFGLSEEEINIIEEYFQKL
ncbi:MAG: DUF7149 domain-containing protein [Bacteroidota bacterium]